MNTPHPAPKASDPIVVTLPQPLKVDTPTLPNPLPVDVAKPIAVTIQQVPEQHESHAAEWNVAIATWVLAAATIFLAIYTWKLFKEATKSSAQARDLVVATLRSQEQANRPIVVPQPGDGRALYPAERTVLPWEATLRFQPFNFGKTPAILLHYTYELVLQHSYAPTAPGLNTIRKTVNELIPAEGHTIDLHCKYRELNQYEVAHLKKPLTDYDALRFFLYGTFTYDDVFGHTYERDFCIKFFRNGTVAYKHNNDRMLDKKELVGKVEEQEEE